MPKLNTDLRRVRSGTLRTKLGAVVLDVLCADAAFVLLVLVLVPTAFLLAGPAARSAEPDRDREVRAALALAAEFGTARSEPNPPPECKGRKARVAFALAADPTPDERVSAPAHRRSAARTDLDRYRDATVGVRTPGGSGSGVVVWSDAARSVVLTAHHVIDREPSVAVRGDGRTLPAAVLAADPAQDLAALLVAAPLPAAAVAEADPADGTEVTLVGLASLWSRGAAGRPITLWAVEARTAAYESHSGDSGGGVFAAGRLVGIHCGRVGDAADGPTRAYHVRVAPIRTLLARVLRRVGDRLVPIDPPAPFGTGRSVPNSVTPASYPPPTYTAPPARYYFPAQPSCPNGRCPNP
jgi:hypothetical protein